MDEKTIPFTIGGPSAPPHGKVWVVSLTKLKTSEFSNNAGVIETSVITHHSDDSISVGARLELSFDDPVSARCAIEGLYRDGIKALDEHEVNGRNGTTE